DGRLGEHDGPLGVLAALQRRSSLTEGARAIGEHARHAGVPVVGEVARQLVVGLGLALRPLGEVAHRRDALVEALGVHLPGATVRGVSAGIHVYVELPEGIDEDAVVARAARAGVSVVGARAMWSPERAGGAAPALVLGYAGLSEMRLVKAAELLGQAVTHGAGG